MKTMTSQIDTKNTSIPWAGVRGVSGLVANGAAFYSLNSKLSEIEADLKEQKQIINKVHENVKLIAMITLASVDRRYIKG